MSGDTHLGLLAEVPGGRGGEVSPPSLTRGNFDEMVGGGPGVARRLAALGAPVVAALCRSVLGAVIYLSHAYPQMMTPNNIMCKTMGNPDNDQMLKHIRHMFMHMLARPFGKTFGGKHLTAGLEQPDQLVHPFTTGAKAAYYHHFSDGSLMLGSALDLLS